MNDKAVITTRDKPVKIGLAISIKEKMIPKTLKIAISGHVTNTKPISELKIPLVRYHPHPSNSSLFWIENTISETPATRNETLKNTVNVKYVSKGVVNK